METKEMTPFLIFTAVILAGIAIAWGNNFNLYGVMSSLAFVALVSVLIQVLVPAAEQFKELNERSGLGIFEHDRGDRNDRNVKCIFQIRKADCD